jgi:hypothetical protein
LPSLKKYYQDGYNAVRRHTSTAYVIMSNRLSADATELLQFAGGFSGAVVDVHYYNLFDSKFNGLTVDQNIDFVRNNRSADLAAVTTQNGRPLTFVGKLALALLAVASSVCISSSSSCSCVNFLCDDRCNLHRGVGGRVDDSRRIQDRLPEVCASAAGGLWTSYLRMGLLDVQEREQPLEYAVDDPKRIHHTQQLEVRRGYMCNESVFLINE